MNRAAPYSLAHTSNMHITLDANSTDVQPRLSPTFREKAMISFPMWIEVCFQDSTFQSLTKHRPNHS